MQLEVDFDVWKALTVLRENEAHSYNEVLRTLLKLAAPSAKSSSPADGRMIGGRELPNGTELRAVYKGKLYSGAVQAGTLFGHDGRAYPSASSAARAVTGNSVNGLTFWEVKRPGDHEWKQISTLPREGR